MIDKKANNNPNWRGGLPNCTGCGKTITRHTKYGMCKQCQVKNPQFKSVSSSAHLGQRPWNKGLEGFLAGEQHPKWNKGTSLNYSALHVWVNRRLGKPELCVQCGSKRNVQWANKSHEYKRDLEDWLPLCVPCHRRYDGQHRLISTP